MANAAQVALNDDHVLAALKSTPGRADLTVTKVRVDLVPRERVVRERADDGVTFNTLVVPVIDESTGEQLMDEIEVVEYEILRGETKCGGEWPLKQILSVNLKLPSDDYAAQIAKATAATIMQQLEVMRSPDKMIPSDHLPLEHWGGCNPHVRTVLNFNKIYTLQQLRDLSPAQIARLPGGVHAETLQEQATAWLLREQSSLNSKANAITQQQLDTLKSENAELTTLVHTLIGKVEQLMGGVAQAQVSEGTAEDQSDQPTEPANETRARRNR